MNVLYAGRVCERSEMGYRHHAKRNIVMSNHKHFPTKYSTVAETMSSVSSIQCYYYYYFDAFYAAIYYCEKTGFAC